MSIAKNPLKVTDTTFRDAHQSNLATRLGIADMEPIAAEIDKAGFYSVEVWGGATFDVCTRFLNEDPWERVKTLKRLMPKTPLQMLLRGQNLVGYRNYPDDVVKSFIGHSVDVGIDIFRVFDALNDERNIELPVRVIKESGKQVQACVCYSLTEARLGGPVYDLDYFVNKAMVLEQMGADSLCVKDMAGLIGPYDAFELIGALKGKLGIPVQLHTHYTSGMASMSTLKAAEAGVDIVDACLSPFALRSSQPAVESLVIALKDTERDTGLDIDQLVRLSDYFEGIAPKYRDLLDSTKMSVVDTEVIQHQVPGGMISNLVVQLRGMGAIDKLDEVYKELPVLREELGYPPLVTPISQLVAAQAINNVLFGRYKMINDQLMDYVYGLYGSPPVPVDPKVVKVVLKGYHRGQKPITTRAADSLGPELDQARKATEDIAKDIGDVLIYALYPTTGMRFLRWKYGLEEPPSKGLAETGQEIKGEDRSNDESASDASLEEGLGWVRSVNARPPSDSGVRVFRVYVDDECFEVGVEPLEEGPRPTSIPPISPSSQADIIPKGPASQGGPTDLRLPTGSEPEELQKAEGTAVRAPMPGVIIRYNVEVGQHVKEGDTILVLEAMKMENALPSPVDGVVESIDASSGSRVTNGQILASIGKM